MRYFVTGQFKNRFYFPGKLPSMRDLLPAIKKWIADGKPFVIARVLQTWGSSPRPVGSTMLVSATGEIAGSVSGGCVEGMVVKEAGKILGSAGFKILDYGVSDENAWTVG